MTELPKPKYTYETDFYITDVSDKAAFAIMCWNRRPFFYDKLGHWWLWDGMRGSGCYVIVSEHELFAAMEEFTPYKQWYISGKQKAEVLNAMRVLGVRNIPEPLKPTIVQFQDVAIDAENMQMMLPSPAKFWVNPLPHRYGKNGDTPIIDKLFSDWVGEQKGKEDMIKALYQFAAYCMVSWNRAQRILAIVGCGSNGKTTYQGVIKKLIGREHCISTSFDYLQNNFETASLYKKLVCFITEVSDKPLNNTSILKQLSGDDDIRYEFKGKQPFMDRVSVKLIMASNSLPATADRSGAFYRRWHIIEFPNIFGLERDVVEEVPDIEWERMCNKCVLLLHELLITKKFAGEGTIQQRTESYNNRAMPFDHFFTTYCVEDMEATTKFSDFFDAFNAYLQKHNQRLWSKIAVSKVLQRLTYKISMAYINGQSSTFIFGLKLLKEDPSVEQKVPVREEKVMSLSDRICEFIVQYPGCWTSEIGDFFPERSSQEVMEVLTSLRTQGRVFNTKPDVWRVV